LPVHVTLRARGGLPGFRNQLVRSLMRRVLVEQARREYGNAFRIVHFSIQDDHLHLIVEATAATLSKGIRGFAIAFARGLNGLLRRKGKVWGDRHHRRDLETPTETRNTLLYVLQNYIHHGAKTFGDGVVDPYSSAPRFDGWADPHATLVETEPWPKPKPRTWMLSIGWMRGRGGRIRTTEHPRIARSVRYAPIVANYAPGRSPDPRS
jgi:REP element-mobilizing transposase RayT